jgi:hypothetical protein
MSNPPTNLRVLKPSRKKPTEGEIFAMGLPDGSYLFGRVIGADLRAFNEAPMPGSNLIYVYCHRAETLQPDLTELIPRQLLLPPVFINRMPWTRGYFQTVDQQPLQPEDQLDKYCFWDAARSRFVDECLNPLPREVQPCGDWGLSSYRWLDDQISDALGIPRVPEDAV